MKWGASESGRDGAGTDRGRRGGFTLVEVCLALLVIALGVMSVISLLPSGLQSSETGTIDTRVGLLAEQAMASMHAKADEITSWGVWGNINAFRSQVGDPDLGIVHTGNSKVRTEKDDFEFLYRLDLQSDPARPEIRKAILDVWDYRGTNMDAYLFTNRFYTEFFFMGM